MDCRAFYNKHVSFVDDLLPSVEMSDMRRHLAACPRCARRDMLIRRSLLLVRNLPSIEPSPFFRARLNARLQDPHSAPFLVHAGVARSAPSLTSVLALAAGLAAVGYLAFETTRSGSPSRATPHSAAVANSSVAVPSSLASSALVASVPTGMPVWPAVLMAGEAPLRFASMDPAEAALAR
jgi:anti-sigma factor RsiW